MSKFNHGAVVADRIKFLATAVRSAEGAGVDWPRELLREFHKWSDDQVGAARIISDVIGKTAKDFLDQ